MKHYLRTPAITFVIVLSLLATACPWDKKPGDPPVTKEQAIAFAKDIASGLRSAQPLVAQLSPTAGAALARGVPIADKVIEAVEASNAATVAALLNDLLPIINEVVAEFTDNVKILAFLALADIGIHFLINHAPEIFGSTQVARMARGSRPKTDAVTEYAKRPAWGCAYHKAKCKAL